MSVLREFDRDLHEPARLVLVANLFVVDEADFVFLSKQTGLTAGNISFHMAKLEEVGYVDVRKEFVGKKPRTTYKLTPAGRAAFSLHRERLREVLDGVP